MRILQAGWFGSYCQLELRLVENAENLNEQEISNITHFLLSSLEQAGFNNLLQGRRVSVKVSYIRDLVWHFQFRFIFGLNTFTISEVVSAHILLSATDAAMGSERLALNIASQLGRLIPSLSEQVWEIRTARNRSYLTIVQGDRRVRLNEASFTITQPFDRQPTVLIALDVHCSRVSEFQESIIVVDGIVLQADARVRIPSVSDDYCYIELNPRIDKIEFSENSDRDYSSFPSLQGDRTIKIWTRPEERSPIPVGRVDSPGEECRVGNINLSEVEHQEFIGALLSLAQQRDLRGYIGDTTCLHNAKSSFLRCAINPCGPCEGCNDYQSSFDKTS